MKLKFKIFFFILPISLLSDQWTKTWVQNHFHWGETWALWPQVFALTYVRNMGAAFGMFQRATPPFREAFFIVLPLLALAALFFLIFRLEENRKIPAFALSLIVAGAIGNLIDRIRLGYVVDFLDFHWKEVYHWPAFNVADSCIVVGVILMFIESFREQNGLAPTLSDKADRAKEGNPIGVSRE